MKKLPYLAFIGLFHVCCLYSGIYIINTLSFATISSTSTLKIIIIGVFPFSLSTLFWIRVGRVKFTRLAREVILLIAVFWFMLALLGFIAKRDDGNIEHFLKNLLHILIPIGTIILVIRFDTITHKLSIMGKVALNSVRIWIMNFPEWLSTLKYLVTGNWAHAVLQQKAKRDYESARGNAHLRMLLDAQKYYLQQKHNCLKQIEHLNYQLQKADPSGELEEALSKYIVHRELQSISGIGATLRSRILDSVFRGSLDDLYRARRLEGIGDERQRAISCWISEKKQNFSERLQQDFLGKKEIIERYQLLHDKIASDIVEQRKHEEELEEILGTLQPHLDLLQSVTSKDFLELAIEPDKENPKVDYFMRGVFAEWETIPDWFSKLVLHAHD